jgi:hypothetical protein
MRKSVKHRRAPARPAKRPSTALVRRSELQAIDRQLGAIARRVEVLPENVDPRELRVSDDIALGELGVIEVKLSKKEEAILNRPVAVEMVQIKPTGQPYVSHPHYTRWLNETFGRGGWNIVPVSKPMKSGNSVVCPYVLYIHGKPAAFAMGEQEYFESNRDQTYGDALESTVASALRRCMKRLGVGLELWDRAWLDRFVAEHCVRVKVREKRRGDEGDRIVYRWRLKTAPAFWNEVDDRHPTDDDEVEPAQRREAPRYQQQAPRRDEPVAHHAASGDRITDKQRKRLWAIIKNSGRDEMQVRGWLERRYGWTSSTEVTRREYEYVCKTIEAPGALPEGRG